MKILVDADACPKVIKEILYRAAGRVRVQLILVANQYLHVPKSNFIQSIQVPGGMDVADDRIVEMTEKGDLVITADIPLAARVIEVKGTALNPRGELYTEDNVRHSLSIRNFMTDLRESGVETGGPAAFNQRDRQAFSNQLDQYLAKNHTPG